MNTNDKAAAKPWQICKTITGSDYACELVGHGSDGKPRYNVMIESPECFVAGVGGIGREGCLTNAALIVQAVNEHAALNAVAEAAEAVSRNGHVRPGDWTKLRQSLSDLTKIREGGAK